MLWSHWLPQSDWQHHHRDREVEGCGETIRAWRQHREFTLDMLADQIGVSKEHLSQIEKGQKSGTVDIFRRLSTILNVALDDLVD